MSIATKFQKSLKRGQDGEALYLQNFPSLMRHDGFKHDFSTPCGTITYELKSDYYSMHSTTNFFIEILSDVDRNKPGGPFQAMRNGTTYYEYLFVQEKYLFSFPVDRLVGFILKNRNKYESIDVQNEGWTTCGVLVPREDLKHLFIAQQLK